MNFVPAIVAVVIRTPHATGSLIMTVSSFLARRKGFKLTFTRIALVLFVCSSGAFTIAQQPASQSQPAASAALSQHEDETLAETPAVVTHHQIIVAGKPLKYTATAGRLVLKPESGPAEAAIFFTAYTLDGEETRT